MQNGCRDQEEQHHRIFHRRRAGLSHYDEAAERNGKQKYLQKMDRIDFLAAIDQMHDTIIGKCQERSRSALTASGDRNVSIFGNPEGKIDGDVEQHGNRGNDRPQRQHENQ